MKANRVIVAFLANRQGDQMDQEGIDFLVYLHNGLALPLQIKTDSDSKSLAAKLAKHFKIHPEILFVLKVPVHNKDEEKIICHFERVIKRLIGKAASRSPFRPA